jgi:hypothetical protein
MQSGGTAESVDNPIKIPNKEFRDSAERKKVPFPIIVALHSPGRKRTAKNRGK